MKRSANFEQRDFGQRWTHAGNKFVIGTLHDRPIEITAQYNPKELARQASATWTPHPNTSAKQSASGDSHLWMEYGTTAPRTLMLELLFDGYEEGISIAATVESLESLTMPVNMRSSKLSERRPQACVAVWGTQSLRCVVTSVATKLTMFDASGEPLRAICNVTLQEVDVNEMMKADRNSDDFSSRQEQIAAHSNIKHTTRRHWTDDKPVVDAWSRAQAQQGKPTDVPAQTTTDAPVEVEDQQDLDDDVRDEQIPPPPAATPTTPASTSAAPASAPAVDAVSSADAPPTHETQTMSDGNSYQVGNPTDLLTTDPE